MRSTTPDRLQACRRVNKPCVLVPQCQPTVPAPHAGIELSLQADGRVLVATTCWGRFSSCGPVVDADALPQAVADNAEELLWMLRSGRHPEHGQRFGSKTRL